MLSGEAPDALSSSDADSYPGMRVTGQDLEDSARAQAYHLELERYSRQELIETAVTERVKRMMDQRFFLEILAAHNIPVYGTPSCQWGDGEEIDDPEGQLLDLDILEQQMGRYPSEEEIDDYMQNMAIEQINGLSYPEIVAIAMEIDR